MAEAVKTIIIAPSLAEARQWAREYHEVVAVATLRSLDRLRGVRAEQLVVTHSLTPAEGQKVAEIANPCLATHHCPHENWTGIEGPMQDLGRWPVVWQCDGCGWIEVKPTSPDSGSES